MPKRVRLFPKPNGVEPGAILVGEKPYPAGRQGKRRGQSLMLPAEVREHVQDVTRFCFQRKGGPIPGHEELFPFLEYPEGLPNEQERVPLFPAVERGGFQERPGLKFLGKGKGREPLSIDHSYQDLFFLRRNSHSGLLPHSTRSDRPRGASSLHPDSGESLRTNKKSRGACTTGTAAL